MVHPRGRPPPAARVAATVAPPFAAQVSGTGLTETGRGNIAIGTPVAGVVAAVHVRVGDAVAAGAPLFSIDDRALRADLAVARAKVAEAEVARAQPEHRRAFLASLRGRDAGAVSRQMTSDAADQAHAAEAALAAARAEAERIAVDLERTVVRAPSAGRVLQVNVRAGEFAEGGGQAHPLMLIGDDARLFLRVDVDEDDAWRVRPGARAVAWPRGNPALRIPLRYEYTEPFVAPRTALSGQSGERADLRVLQVLYSFPRGTLPVYLGQQLDVAIEAPAAPAGNAPPVAR
jgi:multidrug efflux pump subunit AcrA (membrane-fusion protein)